MSLLGAVRTVFRKTGPGGERCCIPACGASPALTVACRGTTRTVMCLDHARRWVDWDGCRRIAEDTTAGVDRRLASWTALARSESDAPSLRPALRSL